MRAPLIRGCTPNGTAVMFLLALLLDPASMVAVRASQSESKEAGLGKARSIAESQHEIVVLLMEKKEFGQALTEANKIFNMRWPEAQEPMLLKELLNLSDRFMHKEQTPLGLQLLETNQRMFKSAASQIAIWKEKGYLLKKMNQTDKALDCFRQAQRLEQLNPR